MKRKNQRSREEQETKQIAIERIVILLSKADTIYHNEPLLAQKYGERARKIAMKAKIKIPEKWQFRFCRKCKKFLYPGINSHVRIKSGTNSRVVVYCELCEKGSRVIAFSKEKLN
ncbi:MAG: ribonuclease P protein component 4 [Candidatus Thorarchaeota archaeon]